MDFPAETYRFEAVFVQEAQVCVRTGGSVGLVVMVCEYRK